MAEPLPFNVTISSQTASIQYSPARDGNLTAGWNVTYSLGLKDTGIGFPQGVGIDSHQTTHDGARMKLSWVGTAIYLYGQATSASYSINIDGSTSTVAGITLPPGGLLGRFTGLPYGSHTLTLVTSGTGLLSFQYAEATIGLGYPGNVIQNSTILAVTTDSGIPAPNNFFRYQSTQGSTSWRVEGVMKTLLPDGTLVPVPQQMVTNTKGEAVSFTLTNTSAFFFWGADNVDHGPKTVSIIPSSSPSLAKSVPINDLSSALDFKQLLYWESGLNRDDVYTVTITQSGSPTSFSFSSLDLIDGGSAPAGTGGNSSGGGGGGGNYNDNGNGSGGNGNGSGSNGSGNGGGSSGGGDNSGGSGGNTNGKDAQNVNPQALSTSKLSTGAIAGIAVAGAVVVLLIIAVLFLFYRRRRRFRLPHDTSADLIDDPVQDTLLPTSGGMQRYSPVPASSTASIPGPTQHPEPSTMSTYSPTNISSSGPMHEIDAGRITLQTLPPQYEGSWAPRERSPDPASPTSQSPTTQPSVGMGEKGRRLVVMTYDGDEAASA